MGCGTSSMGGGAATVDQQAAGLASSNSNARASGASEAQAAVNLLSSAGGGGGATQIEISLRAAGLVNKDFASKSDPMAVLLIDSGAGQFREVGRTEVVANNLSPQWVKTFRIPYEFERVQRCWVRIYDVDSGFTDHKHADLSKQDSLGEIEFTISELVTDNARTLNRSLGTTSGGKSRGTLMVHAEELAHANSFVKLLLSGEGLANMDTFGKSDPFVRIDRVREDGTRQPVFKTEVKSNTLNPKWSPVEISASQLCNGDFYRPLFLCVFDWDSDGSHELIGEASTSLNDLVQQGQPGKGGTLSLSDPKKPGKARGTLHIGGCTVVDRASFLDYVSGGCEISFMVGVDFTASNGNPHAPSSLHYIDPTGRGTRYEEAIRGIGRVLEYYDADRRFPTWGFGGRFQQNPTSHCFALSGDNFNPEVVGVDGVIQAYRQALQHMELAGPTLFTPIINSAASIATQTTNSPAQKYYVLVMLTDGAITDLQETIKSIVHASGLPLSVLIVGVQGEGGADFGSMDVLDADRGKLTVPGGKSAERDIVQFVPFSGQLGPDQLAAELLAELPSQLVEYFEMRGVAPMPRRAAPPVHMV